MSRGFLPDALRGARIGVMRFASGFGTDCRLRGGARGTWRAQGAELVEIREFQGRQEIGRNELVVLLAELKHDLNAYLATLPADGGDPQLWQQVIAFNRAHADAEMALFGQDLFEQARGDGRSRRSLSQGARDVAPARRAPRGSTGCCASTMSSPWSARPARRPG